VPPASASPRRLLIAASGTGGHVFPAIATATELRDYEIEWLGVPDRMETQLIDGHYPLHTVRVGGFQGKPGLGTLKILWRFLKGFWQVRSLLQRGQFAGVFTTGGYISAPAILAARSLGLPVILHESNALPGKVTRLLAPRCNVVGLGFAAAAEHLKGAKTVCTGTPVREQFLVDAAPGQRDLAADLGIPEGTPLVAIVGGSQGAVAVNKLIRQAAPAWLDAGIWVFHQTGDNDPDAHSLAHPHYIVRPFYRNMAPLLQRADLVIARSGAGTLTELAITHTPSILIPYPFAAEDHQTFNAKVFAQAGAAILERQSELTAAQLQSWGLALLGDGEGPRGRLAAMRQAAAALAVPDSAAQVAQLVRQWV
jgi:UDP-N-acetylglucosamine--N-acetylmuramyl-(pentapeptide) pyrophosphoryl-undecaprenol N-acetylglucosamine transferase